MLFKLLIGVGVASGAVAIQDRLPQMENAQRDHHIQPTTGSITPPPGPYCDADRQAQRPHRPVTALFYSDDGTFIITASKDATVKIWTASSATLKRTIELDDGPSSATAVSGNRLLTGHANGTVVLWDWERAEKIATYKRNDAEIWSVTFLGSAQRFAAAGHDWKIAVWDAAHHEWTLRRARCARKCSAIARVRHVRIKAYPRLGSADKTLKIGTLKRWIACAPIAATAITSRP